MVTEVEAGLYNCICPECDERYQRGFDFSWVDIIPCAACEHKRKSTPYTRPLTEEQKAKYKIQQKIRNLRNYKPKTALGRKSRPHL